ncbi:MAG: gamma carbonic anhydrase family protein [Bacteroidales bacterium]|nr:gamma carbonic anhydrase family protein [Bacteroidales bacterium]
MANIISLNGKTPKWGDDCFIASNATLIGDVVIGNRCSIWFNAVLRGDVHYIRIGDDVNIQDCAVIHCTYQKAPVKIGNKVSIAHNAVVHGCTIHDYVLIGIGAIILDNCVINSNSIIAAGALLLENTIVEEGSVYAGVPAKKIKDVDINLLKNQIERIANNYYLYASWYKQTL